MRTPSGKAKSSKTLKSLIAETAKLWRRHHLTYDQARYVAKEVRSSLEIERKKTRKRVVERLSREEEKGLIQAAYRDKSEHGLLIKTLFQTGARVSEFINIRVRDFFFDEAMILIHKAKGGKSRYVPILPDLAQELRTHIGDRATGYLFESKRNCHTRPAACSRSSRKRRKKRRSRSASIRICCAIRSPRPCSSAECRSSRSKSFSATRSWKRHRSTPSLRQR